MLRHALRWSVAFAAVVGSVSVPVALAAGTDTGKSIAHYIMGVSYEFQDEVDAAVLEYQKAVAVDPLSFPAHMRLGLLNSQRGLGREAVQAFAAAVQIEPNDLQARYLLALAYSSIKDFDRAAQQYETILKTFTTIEPQNIDFYIFLGELYYAQGKIDLGIAQFEKVLVIQPKNADALLQVGAYYLDHKKRPEGFSLLHRCVDAQPDQADCLNAMGYAYAEDGAHLDEAREMVVKALAIDPDNAAFLDSLGWVYFKQKKFTEARDLLQKAVLKEEDPVIYAHIGDAYEKLGQMDKALEAWKKALSLDETMAELKAKISRAQRSLKKK